MQARPGQAVAFHEAELAAGNDAVARRYEFHHYNRAWGVANGYVDPENGEVMECVVDGCNDPTPDELGDFAARQMAAFNIEPAACGDEIDDDGDGLVDLADPGCRDVTQASESPACQDGVNNDGRPGTDFDGGAAANGGVALDVPDPHCTTPYRTTEAAPRMCGFGAELAVGFVLLNAARRRSRVRAAR